MKRKKAKNKKNKKIDVKEVRIYLNLARIRKFNQVVLGTSLCLIISLIIYTAFSYPILIFWPDALISILFWLFLGFSFALSFTDDPINLIKPGLTLIGNIVLIILIFMMAIFPWWSFAQILPIAYILYMILFIGLCIGAILTIIINCYVMVFWVKNKKKNPKLFKLYRSGKIKKILLIGLAITGIPFLIMAIPGVIQIPITIEPQDYEAEFAFWGGYGLNDSTICGQLNNHSATLVQCCFHNISNLSEQQKFVNFVAYYNNTYPNISLYYSVPGYPGAFVWDGNTENVIKYAKEIVSVVQHYNLTNVKGLAFDIEGPYPNLVEDIDATPNRKRHDEAMDLWEKFFDWMEDNAPELELLSINYVESAVDIFDEDSDLHYIRRWSFLDMEKDIFEEYAPMSYRCWYSGKPPYGDTLENPLVNYWDGGHYWVYTELNLMAKALDKKFRNHDKMGVYLGLTNCTCYSSAYKGYDNLVRDALIAKHFGVKRITIFLLNTALENEYSMGGVFDSYGIDFLDRFNESVNGKDSTKPFQIWYKPKFNWYLSFGHMEMFFYDKFADLNSLFGIIYISLLFVGNGLVAYYGWKKIKTKVLNMEDEEKRKNEAK